MKGPNNDSLMKVVLEAITAEQLDLLAAELPGGRLIMLNFIHHGRRIFLFTGMDTYFRYVFVFHACNASAKTPIHELRMPHSPSWYSTQHCF